MLRRPEHDGKNCSLPMFKRRPKIDKLTKAELAHVEELELFSRAGIKVCVFSAIDGDSCQGDIVTVGREPVKDEKGEAIKWGLRMNLCEYHREDMPGDDWRIYYDE